MVVGRALNQGDIVPRGTSQFPPQGGRLNSPGRGLRVVWSRSSRVEDSALLLAANGCSGLSGCLRAQNASAGILGLANARTSLGRLSWRLSQSTCLVWPLPQAHKEQHSSEQHSRCNEARARDVHDTLKRLEAWNRPIHRIRGRIEKIFGTWKRCYGLRRMRWRGLAKAAAQVHLTAIAYNPKRTLGILALA